jgi:replicative DNA helicase
MKLSAPIHRLKREAKLLSRRDRIPLVAALDRIAAHEGFERWSLLAARAAEAGPASRVLSMLRNGDLLLVAARPGQGKTMFGLELAIEAIKSGKDAWFFTLEYGEGDVRDRVSAIGAARFLTSGRFHVDTADKICAEYMVRCLSAAPAGTLAVIDYLQLLDQRRDKPALAEQVAALRRFAKERGVLLVFLAQIDRSYDPSLKLMPDRGDIRIPNPVDLAMFDKACFLQGGQLQFDANR